MTWALCSVFSVWCVLSVWSFRLKVCQWRLRGLRISENFSNISMKNLYFLWFALDIHLKSRTRSLKKFTDFPSNQIFLFLCLLQISQMCSSLELPGWKFQVWSAERLRFRERWWLENFQRVFRQAAVFYLLGLRGPSDLIRCHTQNGSRKASTKTFGMLRMAFSRAP